MAIAASSNVYTIHGRKEIRRDPAAVLAGQPVNLFLSRRLLEVEQATLSGSYRAPTNLSKLHRLVFLKETSGNIATNIATLHQVGSFL